MDPWREWVLSRLRTLWLGAPNVHRCAGECYQQDCVPGVFPRDLLAEVGRQLQERIHPCLRALWPRDQPTLWCLPQLQTMPRRRVSGWGAKHRVQALQLWLLSEWDRSSGMQGLPRYYRDPWLWFSCRDGLWLSSRVHWHGQDSAVWLCGVRWRTDMPSSVSTQRLAEWWERPGGEVHSTDPEGFLVLGFGRFQQYMIHDTYTYICPLMISHTYTRWYVPQMVLLNCTSLMTTRSKFKASTLFKFESFTHFSHVGAPDARLLLHPDQPHSGLPMQQCFGLPWRYSWFMRWRPCGYPLLSMPWRWDMDGKSLRGVWCMASRPMGRHACLRLCFLDPGLLPYHIQGRF